MVEKTVVNFDFNKIDDAKRFVYGLWVGQQRVLGVQTKHGWIDFDTMSDDDLMDYASELYSQWYGKSSKLEWRPPVLN